MKSKNRVAIVTGAASNIGAGIVKKLAKENVNIVLNYHSDKQQTDAEALAEEINKSGAVEVLIFQADVGESAELAGLFKFTKERFGRIDILVNNAFLPVLKSFGDFTEDEFDLVFRVNVKAVFFACQHAFKEMNDGGRIINMSSASTALILPNYGLYDSSKGAVEQMTRILSKEIGQRNITVNAVSPGPIETPAWDSRPKSLKESLSSLSSMNRFGTIEEVANVVSFLASDEAGWVTGQNIRVNGGAA